MVGNIFTTAGKKRVVIFVAGRTTTQAKVHIIFICIVFFSSSGSLAGSTKFARRPHAACGLQVAHPWFRERIMVSILLFNLPSQQKTVDCACSSYTSVMHCTLAIMHAFCHDASYFSLFPVKMSISIFLFSIYIFLNIFLFYLLSLPHFSRLVAKNFPVESLGGGGHSAPLPVTPLAVTKYLT